MAPLIEILVCPTKTLEEHYFLLMRQIAIHFALHWIILYHSKPYQHATHQFLISRLGWL
jgi:hypothetical protein